MQELRDLSEQKPEAIEQKIAKTQNAMSEKIETLKTEVKSTLDSAENSVRETISDVKKAFDLPHQVSQRPWTFVAGSLIAGAFVGKLITSSRSSKTETNRQSRNFGVRPTDDVRQGEFEFDSISNRPEKMEPLLSDKKDSKIKTFMHHFDDEINILKAASIGMLLGSLRDVASRSVPQLLSGKVGQFFDSATRKLGGEVIQPGTQKAANSKVTAPTDRSSAHLNERDGSEVSRQQH